MVGPSALIPLENTCADIHEGNYDFHICPFRYIAQMENWDGGFRGIIGEGRIGVSDEIEYGGILKETPIGKMWYI